MLKEYTIFDIFSVHEISSLVRNRKNLLEKELLIILNHILDKMFKIKSTNANVIYWDCPQNDARECDYDFVFHFVEAKLGLGKKEELIRNQDLITLIKNTYEKHKQEYVKKEKLVPRDNRWTKLIILMCWLDLLSKQGKRLWIEKYASYEFTESEPKLPQAWNRVWVFIQGLGISNVNDLKKIKTIDFPKAKSIICSYVPKLKDLSEQNVFNEAKNVMLSKYVKIRKFCNMPFFEEVESFL